MRLISAVDELQRGEAELISTSLDLEVEWRERSAPISFSYHTPVSPPEIDGRLAKMPSAISASDKAILAFGMLEASIDTMKLEADRLVIDPQQPRDLTGLDLAAVRAGETAIVANLAETRTLGGDLDVERAASSALRRYAATVVVTKLAARGALVTTAAGQSRVGAFPTERVWPIGSGDVFAAAFALAWAEQHRDPVDSARFASRAAAAWATTTRREGFEVADADGLTATEVDPSRTVRTYLASPFHTLSQRWLVHLARDVLPGLGSDVFSPFHDVGLGGPEVAHKDLAGLRDCTAVFAVLDGSDPGTVFETGFGTALGLPIVCYSEEGETELWKMVAGTGAKFCSDLSTALYHTVWAGMRRAD